MTLKLRLFLWLLPSLAVLLLTLAVVTINLTRNATDITFEKINLSQQFDQIGHNLQIKAIKQLDQLRRSENFTQNIEITTRQTGPILNPIKKFDRDNKDFQIKIVDNLNIADDRFGLPPFNGPFLPPMRPDFRLFGRGNFFFIENTDDAEPIVAQFDLNSVFNLPNQLTGTYLIWGGILLVLSWALGAFGLSRSLKPLEKLRNELISRNPDRLIPLSTPSLPELRPATRAINRLFADFSQTLSRLKDQELAARHFAYGASHELRNPLAAIKNYLAVLKKDPSENRAFAGVEREIKRTEAILSSLLTLARLEGRGQINKQSIDLQSFLAQFAIFIEDKVEIKADLDLLRLAIDNIIKNTSQYNSSFLGKIEKTDQGIWIFIEDDGPGFDKEILSKAFEPFIKASNGTGLGLALVAAVARAHGGQVKAENKPEGGARVGIWLPNDN